MNVRPVMVLAALGLACSSRTAPTLGGSAGSAGAPSASAGAGATGTTGDAGDTRASGVGGLGDAGAGNELGGKLIVDTTCGLELSDACPTDHASDGKCGLEEAILALSDQASENGCVWSGPIGQNAAIVVPVSGIFSVTGSLHISNAVTIESSVPGQLATIQGPVTDDLFGVEPTTPTTVTFQDLHLIGAGRALQTQSSGISISGETPDAGATVNVTRCWIEQFSNGAIVATDVNLNVSDSTLEKNNNDYGDGGGGIFYDTNGDAASQVDYMTITNSSITHNHSTKGAGVHIQSSSISRIVNSTISDNLTDGGHGGGISFANNAGPLADGVLRIVGSTIAFNGSTTFDGAGIAVGANQALFPDNIDNAVYLAGSIVANNCLAQMNPDDSFTCLSPSDFAGQIYELQDSLLGSSQFSTIVGPNQGGLGQTGISFVDVNAGLDPELADQGGVGAHHPPAHSLNAGSIAIDATEVLRTPNAEDQTHQARGFDLPPPGSKTFDLGAVERRSIP
jgi:hypothetical protein